MIFLNHRRNLYVMLRSGRLGLAAPPTYLTLDERFQTTELPRSKGF